MDKSRSLTFRYAVHMFIFFVAYSGAFGYASAYLLSCGFSADRVGLVLAGATFLSFLSQPAVADYADRSDRNILPRLIFGLSVLSALCFAAIRFMDMPKAAFAVLFMLGMLFLDMQTPLFNALSVYYTSRSWKLNFGIGRGMGTVGFAVASLFLGRVLRDRSAMMLPIVIAAIVVCGLMGFLYPGAGAPSEPLPHSRGERSGLFEFFGKYRWFTASLAGFMLIGVVHLMTENYLVEIIRRLGGDSSHLGIALFIANAAEAPGIMLFPRLHRRFGTQKLLILSAAAFLVKMILYYLSGSLGMIYGGALLQIATYAMFCPVQVWYADECVSKGDMVKGQSVTYSAYILGGAVGNLLGGIVVAGRGVQTMLIIAIALAAAALAVLAFTVPRARRAGGRL